jgi:hypothetical protein
VIPQPAGVLAPQTAPIEPDSMRDLRAPISVSGCKISIRYRTQKGTRQRAHHPPGDHLHFKNVLLEI